MTSALVAIASALFAFIGRRTDHHDKQVQTLIDSLSADNHTVRSRVEELEAARQVNSKAILQLRAQMAEQGIELYILRTREADLRKWARDVMAWCGLAAGMIKGHGGAIPDPPLPPPPIYQNYFPDDDPGPTMNYRPAEPYDEEHDH